MQQQFVPPQRRTSTGRKISPLCLTAMGTVNSNSGGSVNAGALANPMGLPMEILEIKFLIRSQQTSPISGALLGVKFDLGEEPITAGFVPVWNFGKGEDIWDEQAVNNLYYGGGDAYQRLSFKWKLPRPLFVPPGVILTPTLQLRSQVAQAMDVWVAFSARTLLDNPPTPRRRWLPFACSWLSSTYDITDADSEASTEQALWNPTPQAVDLQRMTLRVSEFQYNADLTPSLYYSDFNNPVFSHELFTLQIVDSRGNPIVRDATVPYQLVDAHTRAWELGHSKLEPGAYWKVFLKKTASPYTPAAVSFNGTVKGQISAALIGSREVVS